MRRAPRRSVKSGYGGRLSSIYLDLVSVVDIDDSKTWEQAGRRVRADLADGLVGDVEGPIDDVEAFGELFVGDDQRRVGVDAVPA